MLGLLERYPTAILLSQARRDDMLVVAWASRHRQPGRFADKVATALAADHCTPPQELVRAKADTIQLTATQLLLIGGQRRVGERRMGALLLGGPAAAVVSSLAVWPTTARLATPCTSRRSAA